MSEKPIYFADVTYRYLDSKSKVMVSDFKSKKKGSTFNQLFGALTISGYQSLTDEKIQDWWDKGIIEKNVRYLRQMNVDTDGEKGLSKTDAVRLYKVFFDKLSVKQITVPFSSFDNFTWYSLGVAKK